MVQIMSLSFHFSSLYPAPHVELFVYLWNQPWLFMMQRSSHIYWLRLYFTVSTSAKCMISQACFLISIILVAKHKKIIRNNQYIFVYIQKFQATQNILNVNEKKMSWLLGGSRLPLPIYKCKHIQYEYSNSTTVL